MPARTTLMKTFAVGTVLGLGALIGVFVGLAFAIVAGISRRAGAAMGTGLVGCAAVVAVGLIAVRRRRLRTYWPSARRPRVRGAASRARHPNLA